MKEKSLLWLLTWPFGWGNNTLLYDTIYFPKGYKPSLSVIRHEEIHAEQWRETGFFLFPFVYLFCLPFLFNPWRKKWETEAYSHGQGYSEEKIKTILSSARYGWLF